MRLKFKLPLYELTFFTALIGILYIFGGLREIKEGFFPSLQEWVNRLRELQDQSKSYNSWVGYLYKNSSKNGAILNDFKSRVFQPNCRFRHDWATRLPSGMNVPSGAADTPEMAMIAYKKFFSNLSKGHRETAQLLDNARTRFMTHECWYLSDPSQYLKEFNVGFK